MKKIETRTEPARQHQYVAYLICDLCRKQSTSHATKDWGENTYDIAETKVTMKRGYAYPDSGETVQTEFDICPECFETKLIPWLTSQGAAPQVQEADW